MFSDRTDNVVDVQKDDKVEEEVINLPVLEAKENELNLMPDAFWIVDDKTEGFEDEIPNGLSFDEQINALLAETQNEEVVRKR